MSAYSQFATNKELEKKGVTQNYGDYQILIARAGGANKKFGTVMEAESKPFRRAIQTKTISEEDSRGILIRTYAKAVILDWKGMKFEDGSDAPFNFENVVKIMTDLPDLFQSIMDDAQEMATFKDEVKQEDAGNS